MYQACILIDANIPKALLMWHNMMLDCVCSLLPFVIYIYNINVISVRTIRRNSYHMLSLCLIGTKT